MYVAEIVELPVVSSSETNSNESPSANKFSRRWSFATRPNSLTRFVREFKRRSDIDDLTSTLKARKENQSKDIILRCYPSSNRCDSIHL